MENIRNKIITISGEPASGKSTVVKEIKSKYEKQGFNVYIISVGDVFRETVKKEYLKRIKASKLEKIPYDIINKYRMQIDKDIMISKNAIDMKIEKYRSICIKNIAKLDALSPLKTLTRGYSVVENVDGKIVKKVSDVNKNDDLCVILQDGKIQVKVK